jgi:hypothetical protein
MRTKSYPIISKFQCYLILSETFDSLMENFESLMKQAVSIKSGQMLQKRVKFEAAPVFIKSGLYYLYKFENVRKQGFSQRFAVCDLLKQRGNTLFKHEFYDRAAREYEQVHTPLNFA